MVFAYLVVYVLTRCDSLLFFLGRHQQFIFRLFSLLVFFIGLLCLLSITVILLVVRTGRAPHLYVDSHCILRDKRFNNSNHQ